MEKKPCPISETESDPGQRPPHLIKNGFKFVDVLAPPRGFEPLAGPVLWAL